MVYFSISVAENKSKNDLMIRKMRRFEKDKVIFRSIWSEMTESKSVEVGGIINRRDDSLYKVEIFFA